MADGEVALWASEAELGRLREQKRKLEDEMPYNSTAARKRARTIGIREAANTWKVPTKKQIPRGLALSGDSSSELVTDPEDDSLDDMKPQQQNTRRKTISQTSKPLQSLRQSRTPCGRSRVKGGKAKAGRSDIEPSTVVPNEEKDDDVDTPTMPISKLIKKEISRCRHEAEVEAARARILLNEDPEKEEIRRLRRVRKKEARAKRKAELRALRGK